MSGQKIAVGLSGGVDSSVAAALLQAQGYNVTGVFIEAYNEPGCRTDQDKIDALKVALQLGIPFKSIDVREEYKKRVVDYFLNSYKGGATPNPDVVCNREVKFGIFYEWAMKQGLVYVATGHYARISTISPLIQRAKDITKDQSYFLYQVPADHLPHILWPLGDKTKTWVRAKAKALGLPNADKPDSMGVCMMGELNTREFLREHLGEQVGEVKLKGQVVGQHKGIWFHTVGQRGGFEVDKNKLKQIGYEPEKMKPLYIIGKDNEHNVIMVGQKDEAARQELVAINHELRISDQELYDLVSQGRLYIRIRNLGELEKVSEVQITKSEVQIMTEKPLFGVAEGQAAVLYARLGKEGDEVIVGGGEIGSMNHES